jgi:LuxR family maltose regulon positive regulatory protein
VGGYSFEPLIRPRLIEQIARACRRRVCLIVAPAGYGKSIALGQYLASSGAAYAWFTARSEHRTLLGFARGLLGALENSAAGANRGLLAAYGDAAAAADAPEALAAWFAAYLGRPTTIALDDLHVAWAEFETRRLVLALIERTHPETTWILSSRVPLDVCGHASFPFAAVDPIGQGDLCIRPDEAVAIARAGGLDIGAASAAQLLAATGGWSAAFIFALRAEARLPAPGHGAPESREPLYTYLADQVFSALSDREQRFLLETALLPVIDLDVLAAAGWVGVHEIGAELCRRAGFITQQSATRLCCHDLFRDFLIHRLRRHGAAAYRLARLAAADVLEKAGDFEAAIRLRIDAGDHPGILRELYAERRRVDKRLSLETTEAAVNALPDPVRRSDPSVLFVLARVYAYRGNWNEALVLSRTAVERAADYDDRVSLAVLYAVYLARSQNAVDEAIDVLADFDDGMLNDAVTRARLLCVLAELRAERGETEEALRLAKRAVEVSESFEGIERAVILFNAGGASHYLNRLAEARDRTAAALAAIEGTPPPDLAGRIHEALHLLDFNAGDWESAERHAVEMLAHATRSGERWARVRSLSNALLLATLRRDPSRIDEVEGLIRAHGEVVPIASSWIAFARAVRAAWSGDFAGARRFAEDAVAPGCELEETDLLVTFSGAALFAAASGRRAAAVAALERAAGLSAKFTASGATAGHSAMLATLAKVLAAVTHTLIGQSRTSLALLGQPERNALPAAPLSRSLVRAARAFDAVAQGTAQREELEHGLDEVRCGGLPGFADMIGALPIGVARTAAAFAALTETELDVLARLARGGTTQAIARDIGRSPQTVGSHVAAILRKLGCERRGEAVALAREHGLA